MLEEAYAGGIIGLHNHGTIRIGDLHRRREVLGFPPASRTFAPELVPPACA